MGKLWKKIYSASYSSWRDVQPAIGKEHWHCDRKRGYSRVKKKEDASIKKLATIDNTHQRIGILAQRGVYEFHQDIELLSQSDGVGRVTKILELKKESEEVQTRVKSILDNYYESPFLINKSITQLARGDEGYQPPIPIKYNNFTFGLYAIFDCVVLEPDNTIHIVDFKTGKSDFDYRQAYVYLVAAKYIYPNQKAIASFYNLETQVLSEVISLSSRAIESICIELALVAKKIYKEQELYEDIKQHTKNTKHFDRIFPANPGYNCQYCSFNFICEYSTAKSHLS